MARAPVSKTGGWGFESLHSCHAQVLPRHWFSRAATVADEVFALPRLMRGETEDAGQGAGLGTWGKMVKFAGLQPARIAPRGFGRISDAFPGPWDRSLRSGILTGTGRDRISTS